MSWYMQWSDSIKKRACRYLLQRYLGQFLEEKLTLDQLTVDLYNGTGSVSDVVLDVQALNELGEQTNLPVEFVDGYISEMSVSIPWKALFTDSCFVEVTGMQLTIQPKQRADDGCSMFESMWSSMTSSMQLAAECLQQEVPLADEKVTENDLSMEGLELVARAIESILTRVKIKFVNTVIRLEHLPKESHNGIAVELRINKIDYCDEASSDILTMGEGDLQAHIQTSAFAVKKFHCEGVTFYSDEFPAEGRTFSRYVALENKNNDLHDKIEPQPILIGKLAGRQDMRLKLKQGEAIHGPKVDIELNLGSLTLFLSPRQLHLLMELMNGLAAPHTQDTSNVLPRSRCNQKPMNPGDYEKVEQELQDTLHSTMMPQVVPKSMPKHGWSSASIEESDDEFLPMKSPRGLSESVLSDTSMDTSLTSTNTSVTFNSKSQDSAASGDYYSSPSRSSSIGKIKKKGRRSSNILDSDINGEVSGFHVRLASLAIVLLHEDILTLGVETWTLTPSSVSTMKALSDKFFHHLGLFAVTGYGNKDFEAAKQVFLKACDLNHIRLLAAAVILEGSESGNSYNSVFSSVLSAASMEILECLTENSASHNIKAQYVELLKFTKNAAERNPQPHYSLSNQPDLRIHLRRSKKTRHGRRTASTITEITLSFQHCCLEIDLSIIDRIVSIINPQQLCHIQAAPKEAMIQKSSFSQAVEVASLPESKVDFKLISPFVILKFRFPIPDLRPVHDMERFPWWQRSVRKDILFFHLFEPTLQTEKNTKEITQVYHLYANEIIALFQEGETDTAVPFARATGDDKNENSLPKLEQCFGMPHISLRVCPKLIIGELEEVLEKDDNAGLSQSCFIETSSPKHPSPFMSKRVVHESDTSHRSEHEGEELIIPGDKNEMTDFINHASRDARLYLDISLPYFSVHFPTKHLYEVLYNRINSDLSLWQSAAPKGNIDTTIPPVDMNMFKDSLFCFCKSGLQYDSDSDSNEDNSGIYYSTYDQKNRSNFIQQQSGQSRLALSISVNQGVLNIHTNLRDGCGNVIPEQHGEMQINLSNACLFTVSYYMGIPQHNYVCLQVNNVSMHHKDVVGIVSERPSPLYWFRSAPPHLEPTIYHSEKGIFNVPSYAVGTGPSSKDMLTAAVSTQVNEHRVKTIRIACGLRGATLRHRVTTAQHSWLTQLLDFFDVVDYPVRGYDSPQVITELHQHLWDCAVDYRPVNLPLKCVLTLGCLSVSSNMAARTKTSTLRFIAEDANLYISNKISNSRDPVDLRLDYVSVIEMGLFELSLRLSDQCSVPKVDLRASNNVLHIRTCSDSAHALAQLITYFASDGDLNKSEKTTIKKACEEPLIQTVAENENMNINLTESTVERVNVMMEDAMKDVYGLDVKKNKKEREWQSGGDVEVFFFPDEGLLSHPDVITPVDWAGSDIDSEHDFCMLEHETGSGIMPQSGLPEVRILTATPIHIVDNHFSLALGKADMLCPPKHYPIPVYRYTLRDMTLVWHMYGGQDFSVKQINKKHVTIHESESIPTSPSAKKNLITTDLDELGVKFSKLGAKEVPVSDDKSQFDCNKRYYSIKINRDDISNWQIKGGPGRDHSVLMQLQLNKVKFQHEVYPEKSVQASRQVLLVHELEIRDRLASSHINKFLYQYSSEASPKQSHANMVVIKAVHLRPDPRRSVQETCLKVSLLPLRFNIDQDSLLFLINFVNQLSGIKDQGEERTSIVNPQLHQAPVMSVEVEKEDNTNLTQQSTLLILLEEENKPPKETENNKAPSETSPASPIFVRSFVFSPEVPIRIDYEGKRVDMTHGPLAGLLMGLGQLSCLQLKLKRLSHRHGLLGFDKLISFVISEWLQDIKKTQLPSLLGGVGPMHSLVQLFQGIRDLFWLPIEQYQKDGRIVRGLQRGANSFTTSTAMAALELTARIVQAIQSVAETAFDMLSPGPSVRRLRGKKGKRQTRFSQPADIREGVANAYTLMKEGLGETAETLVRVASAEAEQKGAVGAVGGVLRQIPPTVVAPIILASAATSNLLGGVRSQLAPDVRREATLKWRNDDT